MARIECVVMAAFPMPNCKNEIKTDKSDAMKIALCLFSMNLKSSLTSLYITEVE